jgi:hypothetical protein
VPSRGPNAGIPDMRFINRELPIVNVARELDLRLDGVTKIHCWHPDQHQQGGPKGFGNAIGNGVIEHVEIRADIPRRIMFKTSDPMPK